MAMLIISQGIRAEMQHALYLGLPTLVLPAPNLANRRNLPAYAHVISNLLAMGGPGAMTKIAVRIPVSDPLEIIHQGPAAPPNANGNGHGGHHGRGPSLSESRHHRRMSSLSSRPPSMHQQQLSLTHLSQLGQTQTGTGPIPTNRVTSNGNQNNQGAASSAKAAQPIHSDPSSTWEMWDCIRSLCNYHPRLTVSE
jgi:protein arginine N-methyltransferase 5